MDGEAAKVTRQPLKSGCKNGPCEFITETEQVGTDDLEICHVTAQEQTLARTASNRLVETEDHCSALHFKVSKYRLKK